MAERYQHWLQIFKQLNEHSPTKEDIELIAPSHIKEEYFKLHPPKKAVLKPTPKVKLKRSFDERDCLPEPVLKKYRADETVASENKTLLQTENLPLLRRSPRKHPSSSLVRPTTPRKISSPLKPTVCQSLTNELESDVFQNVDGMFMLMGIVRYYILLLIMFASLFSHTGQPNEQVLRRSPRKHPSSYNEILSSPQKPLLLSQPIVCRRLSSLLGSVSDIENEKESINLNSSFELFNKDENMKSPNEDSHELSDANAKEQQQPFLDEKECSKKKIRRKNENYRRLKMKKSYVRGVSSAKKKFRKWRKTGKKR
uniref:Mitochondrial mRNA-processing protein COX24 C-terminal domain-containing protein n=1 Tax=Elaeophora elaphi TaxID=1147741 RepID=A0A0R3RZQ5_9BILA